MEIGIDSFAASPQNDGNKGEQNVKAIAELLERIELADQVGLDAFGIGEHYHKEFLDSAQSVILAAATAQTKNTLLELPSQKHKLKYIKIVSAGPNVLYGATSMGEQ